MKKNIFFSLLLSCVFLMLFCGFHAESYRPSQGEALANSVLDIASNSIMSKFKIKNCGKGAAMPGGPVKELTLCFETKEQFSKADLRKILIESANEFVSIINGNSELQPFLKHKPFKIENIEIIIYNHDANGRGLHDPEISTTRISQGCLIYRTIDPEDSFKIKNTFEESYENALNALQEGLK